ncbi:hypothetical protein, partial [Nostoc sp. 'Peltigera malacea cyanobiont' DB3992]|uniref:hypothetical protein n=1 Tax=Nostoc sp. 'Peltigera malacea cyanobiont' DB3992 TaxID=1206980 RepID=UPI00211F0D23
ALKHKQIPPSLHFQEPSPQIDFVNSPFYINNSLSDWKANINGIPLRAGVSSFGIGEQMPMRFWKKPQLSSHQVLHAPGSCCCFRLRRVQP